MKYMIEVNQGIISCINLDGKLLVFDTKEEAEELINNSYFSIHKDWYHVVPTFIMEDDVFINYKDAYEILKERGIHNGGN